MGTVVNTTLSMSAPKVQMFLAVVSKVRTVHENVWKGNVYLTSIRGRNVAGWWHQ